MDVVEVSPNTEPPVCRFLDYGKFLFEQKKKTQGSKKKQKTIQVKEIKFRPLIEVGDYKVKVDKITNPFSTYQLALDASVRIWRIHIRGLGGYQFDLSDTRFRSGKEWINAPETLDQRGWFYKVSAGIVLMKGGSSK